MLGTNLEFISEERSELYIYSRTNNSSLHIHLNGIRSLRLLQVDKSVKFIEYFDNLPSQRRKCRRRFTHAAL